MACRSLEFETGHVVARERRRGRSAGRGRRAALPRALPILTRIGSAPSRPTASPGCSSARDQRLAARVGHLDPRRRRRSAAAACPTASRRAGAGGRRARGRRRPRRSARRRRPVAPAPATAAGGSAGGRLRSAVEAAGAAPLAARRRRRGVAAACRLDVAAAAVGADAGRTLPGADQAGRQQVDRDRRDQQQRRRPRQPGCASAATSSLGSQRARPLAERRVQALADVLEPVAGGGGSSAQHRRRIDLQRPADGLRQRAREGGVGQLVEAVGLEQLELARRDLDRRGQRGDVQALRLARLAQQRARRSSALAGAAAPALSLIERALARTPRPRATRGKRLRSCAPKSCAPVPVAELVLDARRQPQRLRVRRARGMALTRRM